MRVREGTNDAAILKSVMVDNEYHVPDAFRKGATVLDIGGHIGTFAALCAQRGANVISVEPSSSNFLLLLENVKDFQERVIPIRAAAVSSPGIGARFLNDCPNKNEPSGHSFFLNQSGSGEDVPTINFDALVVFAGEVDLCKLDCEGAEYGILRQSITLRRIQHIAVELHDAVPFKVKEVCEVLTRNGFMESWRKTQEPFVLMGWTRID